MRITKRRQDAFRLYTEGKNGKGYTFPEIGALLGVSGKTAWQDVMRYLAELKQAGYDDVELMRARHLQLTAGIVATHYRKRESQASARIVVETIRREAEITGSDLKRQDSYTPEQVLGFVRGVAKLFMEIVSDADARRSFATGLKRLSPAMADVHVERTGGAE